MKSIMTNYSDDEFRQLVEQSSTYTEISQKLGYTSIAGDSFRKIKERIEKLKIPTSHLKMNTSTAITRSPENIFIENSTAAQATLRRWYIKGEYSPYICSICGLEPEWQGKPLTLILDHINGQNKDDRLENLRWVCPNCNQQLDTTGYKKNRNENKTSLVIKNYCVDCGCEISDRAVRCKSCNGKYIAKHKEDPIPISREELKDKIRAIPFTEIGREYNVSRKKVIRWCQDLKLPDTKSMISSYSDEEWDKV